MKERAITGKVLSAIRDDVRFGSCAVEVKVARSKKLAGREIKDHQRRALWLARGSRMYYKIGDDSMGAKPFDGFVLKGSEAYVAIWFEGGLSEGKKKKGESAGGRENSEVWVLSVEDVPAVDSEFGGGNITLDYAREKGMRLNVRK